MPRLIIVDDHPLFRAGVARALEEAMGFSAMDEAGTASEAASMIKSGSYDLAIIDIGLPDRGGLDLIEDLAGKIGSPRFFVLSMSADCSLVRRALRAGACGYASKSLPLAKLVLGLELALAGELFVEGELLRDLLTMPPPASPPDPSLIARFGSLTPREREILDALLEGLTLKEAASRAGVSQRTAENYQSSIYAKLGARTPVDLVIMAQRAGAMGDRRDR